MRFTDFNPANKLARPKGRAEEEIADRNEIQSSKLANKLARPKELQKKED